MFIRSEKGSIIQCDRFNLYYKEEHKQIVLQIFTEDNIVTIGVCEEKASVELLAQKFNTARIDGFIDFYE